MTFWHHHTGNLNQLCIRPKSLHLAKYFSCALLCCPFLLFFFFFSSCFASLGPFDIPLQASTYTMTVDRAVVYPHVDDPGDLPLLLRKSRLETRKKKEPPPRVLINTMKRNGGPKSHSHVPLLLGYGSVHCATRTRRARTHLHETPPEVHS